MCCMLGTKVGKLHSGVLSLTTLFHTNPSRYIYLDTESIHNNILVYNPGYGLNHASCLRQDLPLTSKEILKAFIPLNMINHTAVAVTFLMRRVRIHSTVCQ